MKFLIADDHELFLQGLEFILNKEYPDAKIMLADSYTNIFKILRYQTNFDVIITDLAMPGAKWFDALTKIHEECPDVPIIIISAVFEQEILQKTFDIGVSGYVSKSFPKNIIISAINLVLAGGVYIPPELLKNCSNSQPQPVIELMHGLAKIEPENTLTPRQMDVLECLAEGLPNKKIASKLGVNEGTVKIHITLLMRKLDVNNRVSAVREAIKRGLISDNKQ
jgi:DNA-binding NarL/FixJ family response regulator